MTFLDHVKTVARSPQGKRVFTEAQKLAKDPERRRQLDAVRRRLTARAKAAAPPRA